MNVRYLVKVTYWWVLSVWKSLVLKLSLLVLNAPLLVLNASLLVLNASLLVLKVSLLGLKVTVAEGIALVAPDTSPTSIALLRYVREKGVLMEPHPSKLVGSTGSGNQFFDFDMLAKIIVLVITNLNKVIDVNYYLIENSKRSNLWHIPIGIGVQGLNDTFILFGMAFDSPEAQQLNKEKFETIYYHALKTSCDLATKEGPYETYTSSPVSKGVLQPDMWGVTPSKRWDWGALREMIFGECFGMSIYHIKHHKWNHESMV
ncbi:hypothetical protein VNO80_03439 [Phaseolus coccineus]|uniref:Ribonucleotide reductase large subunit C-terminal domain-containing protein n=1 Tax=Phaseolus coccineus TaxID=3886 RepID=A0AAN9RRP8_PHACN